ncbi:Vomp family autotransporter [Bartonella sp. CB169]|uniref:Vomp family autotransporter n=1 Tax=Bartonella sp. CB169 TaxID=3112257 RepID=UPI00300E1E5D
MKKLYSTSNLVKAVSLGTAMSAFLSGVSPVFAGDDSFYGADIFNAGSKVKFAAVENTQQNNGKSKNLNISKEGDKIVNFDLVDNFIGKVITASRTFMNDAGFGFDDGEGPKITVTGIDAGNKKIRGVAEGTSDNEAVNFAQLQKIKDQMEDNTLIEWDGDEEVIKIGAEKEGLEINIKNNANRERVISGVFNGEISHTSTEAINGAQLLSMMGIVADYFGGSDTDLYHGIKPDYVIQTKKYNTVLDAFKGVDNSISDIYRTINLDTGRKFITIGAKINAEKIDVSGIDGDRPIMGVKEATQSNEAVNKAQLDGEIADITESLSNVQSFAVFYDQKNGGNVDYSKVTLGKSSHVGPVDLLNVAAGDIAQNSNAAVNGSQLYGMGIEIASYFGGDARYERGEWKAPTFKIAEHNLDNDTVVLKPYSSVSDAFNSINSSIGDIYRTINDVSDSSLVKWYGGEEVIKIGAEKDGTEINIANSKNGERVISGVKNGMLSNVSTEAVNGSQLFTTNEYITTVANDLSKISDNTSKYLGGGADILAGIEPSFVIKNQKYNDVASAFTGVNISIKDLDDRIVEIKQHNLVQQEGGNSAVITIGKNTAGSTISVAGYANVGRTISGVKAAEKGDEAINKDQLDESIEKISQDIKEANASAVLYDKNEDGSIDYSHVTFGDNNSVNPVALLNVKAGNITEDSTDAINGSQLYSMGSKVAAYFGGGAGYDNGKWTAPNFKIAQFNVDGTAVEKNYNNVADALSGINNGMSNINNRLNDVIKKADSDTLKWNEVKKAYDAGRDDQPSKIINVADGKISKDSKDAINGGQLWKTNERVTDLEKQVGHIDNRVDNIMNTIGDIGDTVNDISENVVHYERDEYGKKTNKVVLQGSDASEPVMIDNVADGAVQKGSKEAVNGGQLHDYTQEQMKIILDDAKHYTDQRVNNIVVDAIDDAVERANNYTNIKFKALNYGIQNAQKEARQAAAIGLAVSNLRYNDIPGKLSVAFGSGLWRSQSAFAFGTGYTSENGAIRSNVSITNSGGHWGVGAGFSMTLN